MKVDFGQKLTLLGLGAVVFYAILFTTGYATLEMMPQFLVSALVFICSGRMMGKMVSIRNEDEDDDPAEQQPAASEEDWARLTTVFNWFAVLIVVAVLALWVIKPQGVSLGDYVHETFVNHKIYDELLSP